MRITDFQLQTESGQLWLDIVERIAAKDAQIAALGAEVERLKAGLPEAWEPRPATLVDQLAAYVVQLPAPDELEATRQQLADQLP
jgi:hypothetical protein